MGIKFVPFVSFSLPELKEPDGNYKYNSAGLMENTSTDSTEQLILKRSNVGIPELS